MPIHRITGWVSFDPPVDDEEEALQTLIEALADDGAEVSYDRLPGVDGDG